MLRRLLELIARYYEGIAPAEVPPAAAEAEPAQRGERRRIFARPVAAERLSLDPVGFCRALPGRSAATALLTTIVPF